MKGDGGMGRHSRGDEGPAGSPGQPGAFVIVWLDSVEAGARWSWHMWEECSQELGDLASKVPAGWRAACDESGGQPLGPGRQIPMEGASLTIFDGEAGVADV
jgi:hypothetical protein